MLETNDVRKIDDLQSSIEGLFDETVEQYSALTASERTVVAKMMHGLDASWDQLLVDVGETNTDVPATAVRALLACGCVKACMFVLQADDEITAAEEEVLLHLTGRFADPLSLSNMTPVSAETSSGTIELYAHLVDTYGIMDHRFAATLCATIDAFRETRLMAKFARFVTLLGTQISFVDGEGAGQRELQVLHDFDETMKRVAEAINDAAL